MSFRDLQALGLLLCGPSSDPLDKLVDHFPVMSAQKTMKNAVSKVTDEPLTPNFTTKDYSSFFLAGALCCTL